MGGGMNEVLLPGGAVQGLEVLEERLEELCDPREMPCSAQGQHRS